MKLRYLTFLLVIGLTMLTACSGPTLDGSSEDAYERSLINVKNTLSNSAQAEFDNALEVIALGDVTDIVEMNASSQNAESRLRSAVDGLTANEVIAAADAILRNRLEAQREQIILEIEDLEAAKAEAESANTTTGDFVVEESRFYFDEVRHQTIPVIEVIVTNGTDFDISSHSCPKQYFSDGVIISEKSSLQ